jgi:hypothetical protein
MAPGRGLWKGKVSKAMKQLLVAKRRDTTGTGTGTGTVELKFTMDLCTFIFLGTGCA